MPPSSTQVAGDRFNPSIQVFLPTRAERGRIWIQCSGPGQDIDPVELVTQFEVWPTAKKHLNQFRFLSVQDTPQETPREPKKRNREFYQNIPSPTKVQKNLAIKMLDKIWDGTKCLKRRLWGWFAEAWRGPAWSSRLPAQLMAARPFVCVPSHSTTSQNLKSCSSQYNFERKKTVKYLKRSPCIQM